MRALLLIWMLAIATSAVAFPVQRCVNLSNFLEVKPDAGWSYDFNPGHLQLIADAGFDTLRLPLRVGSYWQDNRIDPRFAYLMTSVVEDARSAGLTVIVDLHHFDAFIAKPDLHGESFVAIWAALSTHFKGQTGLIFELLNEPSDQVETAQMLPFYDRALAEIREHHPDAWVIFGGARWNHLSELEALPKHDDPKVVHTFHYYSPFEFTHQQAPWIDDPLPPATWGGEDDEAALQADFVKAATHHTQLFLGEFGVFRAATGEHRRAWIESTRRAAEAQGIPWCHWGFGAGFGLFEPRTGQWDVGLMNGLFSR